MNMGEDWPCAPKEQGGYCVDKNPDNDDSPKYECGCRNGYIADTNYLIDEAHGVLHCMKEEESEEEDIIDYSSLNLPCPCPPKSYCSYTTIKQNDFWPLQGEFYEGVQQLYHNCTCRDGFTGEDGWRCDYTDECMNMGEDWPCAPKEQGGYCVDKNPDNDDSPKYECGCRNGYIADTNYLIDEAHGVSHCMKEKKNMVDSEITSTTFNILPPLLSLQCVDDEQFFPSLTSLKVTGNPKTIVNELKELEKSFQISYNKALSSECDFRSLTNVTLFGLEKDGEFVDFLGEAELSSDKRRLRRYLQETQSNNENTALAVTDSSSSSSNTMTTNTTNLNSTTDESVEDDLLVLEEEDSLDLNFNFQFNFTLFFSMIMRCFGCPSDAKLFNDASRRTRNLRYQQRSLDQILEGDDDNSCFCAVDEDFEEASEVANIAPKKEEFLEEFNQVIKDPQIVKIISIKEAITVEDRTNSAEDIARFDPPIFTDPPAMGCVINGCNTINQYCDSVTELCLCLDGYIAFSGRGGTCHDVKECNDRRDNDCHKNAYCTELEPGYECTCNSGFRGNGTDCVDIDECQEGTHNCPDTYTCRNKPRGNFTCLAPTPFPTPRPTRPPPTNEPTDPPSDPPTDPPTDPSTNPPTNPGCRRHSRSRRRRNLHPYHGGKGKGC